MPAPAPALEPMRREAAAMQETEAQRQQKGAVAEDEIGQALGELPYGMYIVGSRAADGVNGMMADWVMQVAFVPRMIAVSIENDARTLINIRTSPVFSVNL